MRKTAIALIFAVMLGSIPVALSAQSGEDAKFKKFQETFWDSYFKFFPTQASIQGYPKYRDKLEDPSSGAVTKFHEGLDAFNQELVSKIDKTRMSMENQIECNMMLDFMDLQFLEFESILPWEYNPLFYNEIFVESVRTLLARSPQLPDAVTSAVSRAKAIPGLVKRAKDNLKTPPAEYTSAAIAQMPGIIEFYRTEVAKLSGNSAALMAETPKVVAALEDWQRYLQGELQAKSTGNFRLGDAHLKMLRLKSQGTLDIVRDLGTKSNADAENIRRQMLLVCIPFFNIMYPDIDIEELGKTKGEKAKQIIIQNVLDKLKTYHGTKDDYTPRMATIAENMRKFIEDSKLVPLPSQTLKVEVMPAYMPATTRTFLDAPGAFDPAGNYTLYIQQVPASWTPDQINSMLEEYNNFSLDFVTAQYVFPGEFVPLALSRKNATPLKNMTANQALLKAWPIYLQTKIVEAGFNEYDIKARLYQLKLQLKNIVLFQLDMNVHEGNYTKEKAVDYMARMGFISAAEAEQLWSYIALNPGEAAITYIGLQEINDLEAEYKKTKGTSFTVSDFLNQLINAGALPLRDLKIKLAS